jgi:hypothetical protein
MLRLKEIQMERVEYRRSSDGRMVPRQNQIQFVLVLGGLLAAVVLIFAALAYQTAYRKPPPATVPIMASEVFVRAELQAAPGDQIYFSPRDELDVRLLSGGRYLIRGWVDHISAAGQTRRFDFSCTIKENPAGDWIKEQLELFPQS